MNAYLCVYRQISPIPKDLRETEQVATEGSLLRKFLDEYKRSFYDWGDDPSFFAAKHLLGDVNRATWGVCRRDVRCDLEKGDVVVFFCGSNKSKEKGVWNYHFIGFGTVAEVIKRRKLLWTNPSYAPYREFYNLLTDSHGKQLETFHPLHKDWKNRAAAPYIAFDPARSAFNLDSPHLVATWDGEERQETWRRDQPARKIERLLFEERNIERRLRTSRTGYAHDKLNLLSDGKKERPGRPLSELTRALKLLI